MIIVVVFLLIIVYFTLKHMELDDLDEQMGRYNVTHLRKKIKR